MCTTFVGTPSAEHEVEARNLASHNNIGREEIIKAIRERYRRLSGNRKKESNAGRANVGGDGHGGGRGRSRSRERRQHQRGW